ncbi:glycosyltransferase family 1 protein, partial [Streptomyces vinaceus]
MPTQPSPAHSSRAQAPIPRPLSVLHLVQPVDGGVARVVVDLVRAQTAAGLRTAVGGARGGPRADPGRGAGGAGRPWRAPGGPAAPPGGGGGAAP